MRVKINGECTCCSTPEQIDLDVNTYVVNAYDNNVVKIGIRDSELVLERFGVIELIAVLKGAL